MTTEYKIPSTRSSNFWEKISKEVKFPDETKTYDALSFEVIKKLFFTNEDLDINKIVCLHHLANRFSEPRGKHKKPKSQWQKQCARPKCDKDKFEKKINPTRSEASCFSSSSSSADDGDDPETDIKALCKKLIIQETPGEQLLRKIAETLSYRSGTQLKNLLDNLMDILSEISFEKLNEIQKMSVDPEILRNILKQDNMQEFLRNLTGMVLEEGSSVQLSKQESQDTLKAPSFLHTIERTIPGERDVKLLIVNLNNGTPSLQKMLAGRHKSFYNENLDVARTSFNKVRKKKRDSLADSESFGIPRKTFDNIHTPSHTSIMSAIFPFSDDRLKKKRPLLEVSERLHRRHFTKVSCNACMEKWRKSNEAELNLNKSKEVKNEFSSYLVYPHITRTFCSPQTNTNLKSAPSSKTKISKFGRTDLPVESRTRPVSEQTSRSNRYTNYLYRYNTKHSSASFQTSAKQEESPGNIDWKKGILNCMEDMNVSHIDLAKLKQAICTKMTQKNVKKFLESLKS